MQKPIGIEMPAISDSLIKAYLGVCNTPAPNKELEEVRWALIQGFNELEARCANYFAQGDKVLIEQLLWERGSVVEQVKQLLKQIDELQTTNGLRSASQSRFAAKVQDAVERLNESTPINRTVSSLEEVEKDEAEQNRLRQAVEDAKGERQQNAWSLEVGIRNVQELYFQNRQLKAKEESLSKQIAQLRLPPEQRKQQGSVLWQGADGTVFQAMRPTG